MDNMADLNDDIADINEAEDGCMLDGKLHSAQLVMYFS